MSSEELKRMPMPSLGEFIDWVWQLKAERDDLRAQLAAIQGGMGEVVEVVAWRVSHPEREWKVYGERPDWAEKNLGTGVVYEVQDLMTVAQHQRIVAALSAQQSAPVTEEPSPLDVIGYASPGQIEILRELPRTGGMKVKGRKDDRYSEPVVLLSEARAAMLSLVVRCQQEGAFKTFLECGYQDGHDEICQFHASNRNQQQSAHVSVPRKLLEELVAHIEDSTCTHDSTHRGGAIWEICDDCGDKWADDRGGKPAFKWPGCVEMARALLNGGEA